MLEDKWLCPKPMVEVDGRPKSWHINRNVTHCGIWSFLFWINIGFRKMESTALESIGENTIREREPLARPGEDR